MKIDEHFAAMLIRSFQQIKTTNPYTHAWTLLLPGEDYSTLTNFLYIFYPFLKSGIFYWLIYIDIQSCQGSSKEISFTECVEHFDTYDN